MAIRLNDIEKYATSESIFKSESANINESIASMLGYKTAFLCHSHADKRRVIGVVRMLKQAGWDVYVDWQDQAMPEKPDKTTARRIKAKISRLDYFLFLATDNSMSSRWCPWEIGYADGVKTNDSILVIPTMGSFTTYGSEYLQLYSRIDIAKDNYLAVFKPNESRGVVLGSRQV